MRSSSTLKKCAYRGDGMNEADILAKTYYDVCTVFRPKLVQAVSGESTFKKGVEGKLVYKDIPCALSHPSGGRLRQSPATATAPMEYSLFVRPEVDIEPNDFIIITQLGKKVVAVAGRSERQLSHNNVPLKLEKDVV